MKILAESQKLVPRHIATQAEHFRTFAHPLPGYALTLAVVISGAKMLLEILLGILEVVLGFRREHGIRPKLLTGLL